jgi:wyosine [tRNA(Phe)-imidazoG37] synthetase (radical SAM superfamily)
MAVGPAVGGFVEAHLFEAQVVSVVVAVERGEDLEGQPREVFGGRHAVEYHRLVAGHGGEEVRDLRVAAIDEEGMIPGFHDMAHGDLLDLGKVHHHAVVGPAGGFDDLAGEGDFQRVAVPVQVAALALVIGNAMAGIELEAAGDLHGSGGNLEGMNYISASGRLTIQDHSRDSAGMVYVYPVVSRRAGGVSVGINLNPNNACNWRCIYCQVPDLKRGGSPPIDLARLEAELREMLTQIYAGDFLARHAPEDSRRVVDVAFSGNGEPTSASEFPAAVETVCRVLDGQKLAEPPILRLITNGSLLDRPAVRRGIARIGAQGGETWFKVDVVGATAMRRINGVAMQPETVLRRLRTCGSLCPTWVQTCLFALDGEPPAPDGLDAYVGLLRQAAENLTGVHLYGLARPSRQPEAARLSALPAMWLEELAERIGKETGLTVRVSP